MYLYEDHLGGIYASEYELDYEDLYCEQCGDSDWYKGEYSSIKEFWDLIKEDCSINGSGGWALQYIYPFLLDTFGIDDIDAEIDYQGESSLSDDEILKRINKLIRG